jgi:kumamolisin
MSPKTQMISIPGSNRPPNPKAKLLGRSDPKRAIEVSIYVRQNPVGGGKNLPSLDQLNAQLPGQRKYLNDDQFKAMFGADQADVDKVVQWAKTNKLAVVDSNTRNRRILVKGTVANINKAFGIQLNDYDQPKTGRYRGREGEVYVPAELGSIVEGVYGLDNRPVGHSRMRHGNFRPATAQALKAQKGKTGRTALADLSNQWPGTFFPTQVSALYDYPAGDDGTGQNVAVFAFNGQGQGPTGGYSLDSLKTYFEQVLGGKTPSITDVVVTGPGNDPGPDTQASSQNGDATGEVMLDMCVVGSVAPGAKMFMYFTEFTTQGWVDAIHQAITDNNNISVISISYGNPENGPNSAWHTMGLKQVNTAFQAAAAKGITICVASGDDGSADEPNSTVSRCDFPASSPFVLGVGGTNLTATDGANPTIASEVVWNEIVKQEGAGGGGISAVFSKPTYQNSVTIPHSANSSHKIGRGVPDVASVADPETGVVIMHVSGQTLEPIGGTSAGAPMWAALIARLNQGLNARCGFLNQVLYTKFASNVLRDIVEGNNGAYAAGTGWDACTGLGVPGGATLLQALSGK